MNNTRHLITDAHGRPINLASSSQISPATPAHSSTAHPRRRPPTVIVLAALLIGGLLMALLLIVIRDIATLLVGPGLMGTALKVLLARPGRREQ